MDCCTLPVLHCNEVFQHLTAVGHFRHFERVQATSAVRPIATDYGFAASGVTGHFLPHSTAASLFDHLDDEATPLDALTRSLVILRRPVASRQPHPLLSSGLSQSSLEKTSDE